MPERVAHTEYCSHPLLVKEVTGHDPREDPSAGAFSMMRWTWTSCGSPTTAPLPKAAAQVWDIITLANCRAWARTSIPFFICHDDIVWTSGPVFHPEWYRRYVFSRYARLWEPLKEAGKKVLFCSDGDFTMFADDLAGAGADGFIFEPLTSLEQIAGCYGSTKVIVGNADTRILTFGSREEIRREVERCMSAGKPCPGFVMAVGNHIPYNVPIENALYYFELVRRMGRR